MNLTDTRSTRADLQKRTEPLSSYLHTNMKVQADELPAEDPTILWLELDQTLARLATSIAQINRIDPQAQRPDGYVLTNAIIQHEMIALRQSMIASQIKAIATRAERDQRTANDDDAMRIARLQQEYDNLTSQQEGLKRLEVLI